MAQSIDFNALKARTMGSSNDEEAVTVDTRGLISKVLSRYSGKWTVLREMIQNASDASATRVTVKFETLPSTTVPLPSSADPSTTLKHVVSHHTLRRLLISNNGHPFTEKDWARLKRIADGNPDETKIGAFGVGFYSVFDDFEEPFVSSGNAAMAFYWKGNSLFTRRLQLGESDASPDTTFVLDYRNNSSPVPSLLELAKFLSTSLTFVGLENIDLWLDDWNLLKLTKKVAPSEKVPLPRDIETRTVEGLMKIAGVTREVAQVDAAWMNILEWSPQTTLSARIEGLRDTTTTLRSFFSKFTGSSSSSETLPAEPPERQRDGEDLTKTQKASVFLHINTASIQASISSSLASELERATRKPPPKRTTIAILTPSYSTNDSSESSEVLSSVLPSKSGRIFIGFPTHQTTGLNAHISAPSVIPTVERESIDLNTRYISRWNIEMLRAAGIVCRIAWTADMSSIKDRIAYQSGPKIRKDNITSFIPEAIHTANQFTFRESTPSATLGRTIEDSFWMCNKNASIEILSTCGILPSHHVRIAPKDLSFMDGIPSLPEELVDNAKDLIRKLTDFGLLTEVTVSDIKRELENSALTSVQLKEFLLWVGKRAASSEIDQKTTLSLLSAAVANEEESKGEPGRLLTLAGIDTYLNPTRIPSDLPLPPSVMPFQYTKSLDKRHLDAIGWKELQIVPWLRWLVENAGNRSVLPVNKDLTRTPSFSAQVLPILSKQWDTLSQSSKQTVVNILQPRTIVPVRNGMKRPEEAYFPSVRLFDDLPVVTGLAGVKEKFLAALGVRKTVELGVIFERLLRDSDPTALNDNPKQKWSHVDLIKYLASVSDDIPAKDIERLKNTKICLTEDLDSSQPNRQRYKISELFEPKEAHRKLGLPIIDWPGKYFSHSKEAQFLSKMGLRGYPSAMEVIEIMAKAALADDTALQTKSMSYFITEYHANRYNAVDMRQVTVPFLPIEGGKKLSAPKDCFTHEGASLFGFDILRRDLHPQSTIFGVREHPPINDCVQCILATPPKTTTSAKSVFAYMALRISELKAADTSRLGEALIIPISNSLASEKEVVMRYISPRNSYLGDGEDFKDIFDFVNFGKMGNLFLQALGSKQEPTKVEVARMLVKEPARISSKFQSPEKYLNLLRSLAENISTLKRQKDLFRDMTRSPFLLASKELPSTASKVIASKGVLDEGDDAFEDDEQGIKEWRLTTAKDAVIVDDYQSYTIFKEHILAAPQEESLEKFYAALGTPTLSSLVEERASWGAKSTDQTSAVKLQKLVNERTRLFLHEHSPESVKRDTKWLEKHLSIVVVHSISLRRSLRNTGASVSQSRHAIITPQGSEYTLWISPGKFDLYEISQALVHILLARPKLHSVLTLEMLLKTDLYELRARGYNISRILRKREMEARMAENLRQKEIEEEKLRIEEREVEWRKLHDQRELEETKPQHAMPGIFPDSPSNKRSAAEEQTGITEPSFQPRNLFSNLSKHLGLEDNKGRPQNPFQSLFKNRTPQENGPTPSGSAPPPYSETDPKSTIQGSSTNPSEPKSVTSPSQLHNNLLSAISACRPHGASGVYSRPATNQVNETKSYCDERPSQDLEYVATLPSSIHFMTARSIADRSAFLSDNLAGINEFAKVLVECASIFSVRLESISIFYDPGGKTIAFNRSGSLFCNYIFFKQLHQARLSQDPVGGRAEAMVYWWVILCHELAHNLVEDHSSDHSFYTFGNGGGNQSYARQPPRSPILLLTVGVAPIVSELFYSERNQHPAKQPKLSAKYLPPAKVLLAFAFAWQENPFKMNSMDGQIPSEPGPSSAAARKNILYLDAYDSFSNNVISMLEENLDVKVTELTVDSDWPNGDMRGFLRGFDAVVLGPGPGHPESPADVGIMNDLWTLEGEDLIPVLGICLGFQSLCLNHGLAIKRLPCPLHGQVHRLAVMDRDIFAGMNDFEVTLYHSLYASTDSVRLLNPETTTTEEVSVVEKEPLSFLAWLTVNEGNGLSRRLPMAARHKSKPFWGFQFHPESCKSNRDSCTEILKKWWAASAAFNLASKRTVRPILNDSFTSSLETSSVQEDLRNLLEGLTAESSQRCFYRSLPLQGLYPEHIFELVNSPGSPSILYQSNGRFSIMSVPSPRSWRIEYSVHKNNLLVEEFGAGKAPNNRSDVSVETFWDSLRHIMNSKKVTSGKDGIPFWGGFLGFFSYEMGLAGLSHPKTSPGLTSGLKNSGKPEDQETDMPDVGLLWIERCIVVDNVSQTIYIQSTREVDEKTDSWLDVICQTIQQFSLQQSQGAVDLGRKPAEIEKNSLLTAAERELIDELLQGSTIDIPDEATYKSKIIECQEELKAGESYELCLCGKTTITVPAIRDGRLRKLRPWLIYKKLKTYNPAAYSAYGSLGCVKIASSSPECFVTWDRDSTLEMKPMKGTVRKSPGMTFEKAKAILATTKEIAENLMIADLIRHDLYGICGSGNVHVEKLLDVEDNGRVYSMVTHVKGIVDRTTARDHDQESMAAYGLTTLQRTLPPGSMTGAPKERSCMHLDRIEGWKRGVYSGVMGYLDLGGSGTFSVMIRTAFSYSNREDDTAKSEEWRLGAGGAITILSTPQVSIFETAK
ncbi:hypothetical protein UA08_01429 [Talaromyces atroroseus]|uniref:p-aminobenzoic acid synthase n=1 Tax=Talaromyces atroroseus TaxID=1441469 RepID=A0A1Q5QA27_TALAT|nr:hypothetical protein UA08_01429 [Talaromyces atroroseus]OKL62741.1 hypothetical protein UA08_01429 [Talaromyces atroroseus]